jgi:hypothetical protein
MDLSTAIADLDAEIAKLQKARDTLATLNGNSSQSAARGTRNGKGAKTMSASARRRISLAKKKWWAARKKG